MLDVRKTVGVLWITVCLERKLSKVTRQCLVIPLGYRRSDRCHLDRRARRGGPGNWRAAGAGTGGQWLPCATVVGQQAHFNTPLTLISVNLGSSNSGDTMRQGRTGPHRPGDGGIRSNDLDDLYAIRASDHAWRVSSRCAGNGACAEVAQPSPGRVAIRDGMNPQSGKVMIFTQHQWGSFLARIKAGQFDVR